MGILDFRISLFSQFYDFFLAYTKENTCNIEMMMQLSVAAYR